MDYDKLKLCYINQSDEYSEQLELYFTEKEISEQWGDDWDDAPYEHNAGEPYENDYSQPEQGVKDGRGIYPKINIYKIYVEPKNWNISFITPRTGTLNSPYSVKDINEGVVPWLVIKENNKIVAKIMVGTTYNEFIEIYNKLKSIIIYEPRLL